MSLKRRQTDPFLFQCGACIKIKKFFASPLSHEIIRLKSDKDGTNIVKDK